MRAAFHRRLSSFVHYEPVAPDGKREAGAVFRGRALVAAPLRFSI
jgi:hypothetical protein